MFYRTSWIYMHIATVVFSLYKLLSNICTRHIIILLYDPFLLGVSLDANAVSF